MAKTEPPLESLCRCHWIRIRSEQVHDWADANQLGEYSKHGMLSGTLAGRQSVQCVFRLVAGQMNQNGLTK